MTAPVFRLDPLPDAGTVVLAGDEGRHAATVRRMRVGERIDVTDGRGTLAECVVSQVGRDRLELRVEQRRSLPTPSPRLVVVQALVKGERSELAVELLTELGVDEIVPWEAERCVARWAGEKSARRWSAAAEAAAKQSRRVHWPLVAAVAGTDEVAARLARAALAAVLSEAASLPLTSATPLVSADRLASATPNDGEIAVVVGPEGGISPVELESFAAVGARSYRLGDTVLRASTAGAAAASVLLAATGRW
ncbi:MAG TPA: 16S rRNA (uracil(1498)-N(3))-methyltransferase [Frankiaceae bacterium]|nr:16S rRNA (uracil(1498)-N(3))-methyltransferase [Frankiaceae bacterium]